MKEFDCIWRGGGSHASQAHSRKQQVWSEGGRGRRGHGPELFCVGSGNGEAGQGEQLRTHWFECRRQALGCGNGLSLSDTWSRVI